jgi:hypothetical protein
MPRFWRMDSSMTDMDVDKIRVFVEELDTLVPEEEAAVRLEQYGGPEEYKIVANEHGLLRLGIELLKVGLIPLTEKRREWKKGVPLELDELVLDDSTILFDWCEFEEDLGFEPRPRTPIERAMPIGCGVALVALVIVSLAGIGAFVALTAGWID